MPPTPRPASSPTARPAPSTRWRVRLTGPGDDRAPAGERAAGERLVRQHYAHVHGARLDTFLPWMLALSDGDRLGGVIGTRCAQSGTRLFLETYLDRPVEALLADATGAPVPRADLAEVGNLAAARRGLGPLLVGAMASLLSASGRRWAVFTATAELRALFAHLQLGGVDLGAADGRRLGPARADWGRYYDDDPRVVAADLAEVVVRIRRCPALVRRGADLWERAASLGRRLGRAA